MKLFLNILLALALLALLFIAKLLKGIEKLFEKKPEPYSLEPEQNRLLALAHPMAEKKIERGYAEHGTTPGIFDDYVETLRPLMLHFFGFATDTEDTLIRAELAERLRKGWFRIDLDALRPTDNPRYAMAFACARVTFVVRAATLLGWLDEDVQWDILELNNQRAKDCFTDWQDFGCAWALGRKQWIRNARADAFGAAFGEEQVEAWVRDKGHPWGFLGW